MDEGDCQYYCCGKCRGLFEELDALVAHKGRKCDGNVANSDCELFACERRNHVRHLLQQNDEEPKETPVSVGKRRKALHGHEDDEVPLKKKAKENIIKKLDEKKDRVRKSLQDVTAGSSSSGGDYLTTATAGRRSSGRIRSMPAKYKDFAHDLVIKKEPDDDSVDMSGCVQPEQSTPQVKLSTITEKETREPDTPVTETEPEPEVTKSGHEDPPVESGVDNTRVELELDTLAADDKIENLEHSQVDINESLSSTVPEVSGEVVNITQNVDADVENRTESRVETRTRRNVKVKYEPVVIKDEPDALIKEIFKSDVKKPNIFTKEQKEELAEKYKQYYKIFEKNIKKETGHKNEAENKSQENDTQLETEKETENIENEGDKEEEGGDDGKEKENQPNKRKAVKKKYVFDKDTSKPVVASERSAAPGRKSQWRYHCPVCAYTTPHVGFFEHHMTRAHDNGKLWRCNRCEYTHHSKGVMRLHINAHVKPYMCEFCSHKFSSGIDLKKHRYTHTGETPYKCTECDWAGRQKKALVEHMRKHTGDRLKCSADGCDFETNYAWALEQHRRSKHEAGHRFQCAECPYATSDSGSFHKHKKYHQGLKDYRCGECSYKGVTKNDVIKHMRIHTHEKIYFCDRCRYSSCHSSAFKAHMMSHLGLKSWQCKLCGFSGAAKAKVIRHLETKHKSHDKANAISLPTKFQFNFDDFKVPHDANSQTNIVYEVIETVEGMTDETGAIVVGGQDGEMSIVTHVDPNEFQGLADLAAASEAVQEAEGAGDGGPGAVTQIIVQHVEVGAPGEEEEGGPGDPHHHPGHHIELTSLPPGGVVTLPGGIVNLPPGVLQLQPGEGGLVTTGDGSANITLVEGQWPTTAEHSGEESVVIIEQPAT